LKQELQFLEKTETYTKSRKMANLCVRGKDKKDWETD